LRQYDTQTDFPEIGVEQLGDRFVPNGQQYGFGKRLATERQLDFQSGNCF